MHANNPRTNGPTPLHILIVGGGIGGLSAGLFLRQAGHIVEIFESSQFAAETGAVIHIPPNANGLLRRIGIVPEAHEAVTPAKVTVYDVDGSQLSRANLEELRQQYPYPWQLMHRENLHSALKDLALSRITRGTRVTIHLRSKVIDVNCEEPSLTLNDGSKHFGDLIIGADGVHSRTRAYVQPNVKGPFPSGTSAYHFLVPISALKNDPRTAHLVENEGNLFIVFGINQRISSYPCKKNTALNFVCTHVDERSDCSPEGWNVSASKEALLKACDSFSDFVKAILRKAEPEDIKTWKLLDCKPLTSWVRGKVAIMGDAAHPLPYQGQGGAQALEDSAALGALLPFGTEPCEIASRLELYSQARKTRAEAVQEVTRQSANDYKAEERSIKPFQALEFVEHSFNHDAYHHGNGILRRYILSRVPYRRMPTSFGPTASPRQTLHGIAYNGTAGSTYRTTYATFRTPKAYVETFLPSEEYKINCRGGWATATFSHTKLANLRWLGGRGYSHFGLYIHDVTSEDPTDKAETGTFVPVVFENLTEPIITGREELGFSKVFATLTENFEPGMASASISASWDGLNFLDMTLGGVDTQGTDGKAEVEVPTYHYKCIPASGPRTGNELVDSAYGVIARTHNVAASMPKAEKKFTAKTAMISFTELEGLELEMAFPTLANIIAGLREVKIGAVLSAGVKTNMFT